MALATIFLIVALVLFILSAVGVGGRINLASAGLACLTAALLVGRIAV